MKPKAHVAFPDMIAAGRYDSVDLNISERAFPLEPALFATEGVREYRWNKEMTTRAAAAEMARDGCAPARLEHLLAYGGARREKGGPTYVVAAGTSWNGALDEMRRIPLLWKNELGRHLVLIVDEPGADMWPAGAVFLAVPAA